MNDWMQKLMQADLAMPNNVALECGQMPGGVRWYGPLKVILDHPLFVSGLLDKADRVIVGHSHLLPDLAQGKVQLEHRCTSCCRCYGCYS